MSKHAPKKLQSVYFQNLDAARFFAAFAVFLLHFSNEIKGIFPEITSSSLFNFFYLFTSKGNLGVNFFFVLSGFLITYLILNERKTNGTFNLKFFLIRRTLRIWPLYFLIGVIGFFIFPLIFKDYSTLHQPLNYFLFLANFDEIWFGARDSINFLTAPWSVAVEEQFYLFWGVALLFLFKIKTFKLSQFILILYLISFVFRYFYWQENTFLYHHTLAVCQDILTGAFIGFSLYEEKNWLQKLQKTPKWLVIMLYIIGSFLCIAKNKLFGGPFIIIERFILSLFFGFILLDQIRGEHSFFKFGKVMLFNKLGKISYGIYMYHLVIMYLLLRFIPFTEYKISISFVLLLSLSSILTFFVSYLSYTYFESKFLSLKHKFTRP